MFSTPSAPKKEREVGVTVPTGGELMQPRPQEDVTAGLLARAQRRDDRVHRAQIALHLRSARRQRVAPLTRDARTIERHGVHRFVSPRESDETARYKEREFG